MAQHKLSRTVRRKRNKIRRELLHKEQTISKEDINALNEIDVITEFEKALTKNLRDYTNELILNWGLK